MYCPECKSENSDSAKFCKKCGKPLKKSEISHQNMIKSINKDKSSNNDTTKIIIISLIVIAVVLAGALVYIYGFSSSNDDASQNDAVEPASNESVDVSNEPAQETQTQQASPAPTPTTSAMSILGGTFSTGSDLSDKTYASIYVGPQHSGEKVTIQILYSRDGSSLNNGNMVSKTVDSSGYIDVSSAESYKYYPDFATVNLYDTSGNMLDSVSVNLSPESGTQSF